MRRDLRRTRLVAALVALSVAVPCTVWWFKGHAEVEQRVRAFWGDPTERARFHSQRLSRFVAPRLATGAESNVLAAESFVSGAPFPGKLSEGLPMVQSAARVPPLSSSPRQWSVSVDPQPFRERLAERLAVNHRDFNRTFAQGTVLACLVGLLIVLMVRASERDAEDRTRFATLAAHELRTPLASLRLHSDLLGEDLGDPTRVRDYARRVAADTERLERVVANVLGFARQERGALVVRSVPGDVGIAVREIVDRLSPVLESQGARVELSLPSDPPRASFDRGALDLVLSNLLDNAERYARAAADRTIRVALGEARDRLEVTVEDRGPGVAAPAVQTLFTPFVRGAGADGPEGLGLGLAQARSLARAMRGDLRYEPRPGGGASFLLSLRLTTA